jgi:RimJ/RimL family protein N-acetyltransferase
MQTVSADIQAPIQPQYPIHTARLRLRPVRLSDVAAVNAYRSVPDVALYLPHPPHTVADTEKTVASMVSQEALTEPGQWLDLAVELAETGEVVGEVLLKWSAADPRQGEVGYAFNPAVHGQGIASEAVKAALALAFDGFGWHRVEGICDERNDKSAAVMARQGMRLEATFKEADWCKGEWVSLRHYALLRREWLAAEH